MCTRRRGGEEALDTQPVPSERASLAKGEEDKRLGQAREIFEEQEEVWFGWDRSRERNGGNREQIMDGPVS